MSDDEKMILLLEDTETQRRIAAAQVSRRHRGVMDFAELSQEAVIWVITHPGTVQSRLEDGRRGHKRLTDQIAGHLDGVCRANKAQGLYDVEDEQFYTRGMLEATLPAIWDSNYAVKPPDEGEVVGRGNTDPAVQGTWQVMVLDTKRAWDEAVMDEKWRTALFLRYGDNLRIYQVATVMQVADATAHGYINRGIKALVKVLGGPPPVKCGKECECKGGPVGTRKVISNAQAQAQTEEQYAEG